MPTKSILEMICSCLQPTPVIEPLVIREPMVRREPLVIRERPDLQIVQQQINLRDNAERTLIIGSGRMYLGNANEVGIIDTLDFDPNVEPTFLRDIRSNFGDEPPEEYYDFVHVENLPSDGLRDPVVLNRLTRWLRPGGTLMIQVGPLGDSVNERQYTQQALLNGISFEERARTRAIIGVGVILDAINTVANLSANYVDSSITIVAKKSGE